MLNRRDIVMAGAALAGSALIGSRAHAATATETFVAELKKLEAGSTGRLGVAVLDTATGAVIGHRLDERFAMCSTFKLLAAAAVLERVDAGKETLGRRIRFSASDLVPYSPVTKQHTGGDGLSVAELCEAAVAQSDNTAANLLVASLGGPPQVTAFARTLGDLVTRLDRVEPDLNEGQEDDVRDTTTPQAMALDLQALTLGKALSPASRDQLIAWLVANTTGDTRIRAGLPAGWRVGDKTGSGENGTSNDVAVIWPQQRAPVIISVYLTQAKVPSEKRNATIAAAARAAVVALSK
ncbi:class A beta-lactamase [Bradyrhizobium prioriisuperbiae]|uniref:class A beta-lactamase n=1 Tax=Bradyrhizobium prioriisuperbiae TaxID=2854389 RepID=UPI0028EE1AD2|nr:class A beta-lactamase [Bradyrhizobium prioritasuperba]